MKSSVARNVDWGHLLFLAVIAALVMWYLLDAVSVSTNPNNLLLILPVGVVVLAFCGVVVLQCFKKEGPERKPKAHVMKELSADEIRNADRKKLLVIGGMAGALGVYVLLLNIIGFDVATVLFSGAAMFICGERRPVRLLVYALVVGGLLTWGFRVLLPFPMYTLIL